MDLPLGHVTTIEPSSSGTLFDMGSEFSGAEWIASNDLAFAIRDRFPVSPGHCLVIPRRVVATWDETTAAERSALIALMTEVKDMLRDAFRPDGFNAGFNEGAAAGQTVFHLHIHVIPRFTGDVPDPRGGIRHAVMGAGNWQA
ncbi:MAG TPA: HIT family protein [Candidatus Nanopelagicales bacterium]|nr:HIT family protein [Candidatus Nanopelagicales bacterium]